jgi:hypothetical protein
MALAITTAAAVRALPTRTGPGTPAVIVTPVVLALRPSSLLAAVPGKHHADHHGGGDRHLQHHVILAIALVGDMLAPAPAILHRGASTDAATVTANKTL